MTLEINKIHNMDCIQGLKMLPDESVDCCITSPPYYHLRDYGVEGQIGHEDTVEEYVESLVKVFDEVYRVLKTNGTLWLNLGDTYSNKTSSSREIKRKDLIGIPWMVAFALRNLGWYLRQDIIWHKPNAMPESVKDRCTNCHEYIFLMSKTQKYYFDYQAIQELADGYDGREDTFFKGGKKYNNKPRERWQYKNLKYDGQRTNTFHEKRLEGEEYLSPIRNKRDVWSIPTKPFDGAHFATFPEELVEQCMLAGCPEDGIVLDPFMGAGTTAIVADRYNRSYIGFEINPEYVKIAEKRIAKNQPRLNELS